MMDLDGLRAHGAMHGAAGGVRAVVLGDGASRGVRVLEVRTGGGLRFDVIIDRGLDLGATEFRDQSIGWRSPGGERHPAYVGDGDEDGFSWMRSFSGLLMTGGLSHIFGPATEDVPHFAHAPRQRIAHPLHGRIAHVPAEACRWGEDWSDDGTGVVWIEGQVRQFALAAEHLVLERRIEAPIGGSEIRIVDRVRNAGYEPTAHGLLYHVNVGWPLLSADTRVEVADIRESTQVSGSPVDDAGEIPGPVAGFPERVHVFRVVNQESGLATASFRNPVNGLRAEVAYDADALPVLVEWVFARAGQYVAAVEPATHAPGTPHAETMLGPGEAREYRVTISFGQDGPDSVG